MPAIVLTRRPNTGNSSGGSSITGLTVTVINGQPMLTLEDTTRSNKILSVAENVFAFAENALGNQDWIRISNASDADSGFIADFDGTIVNFSAHCENTGTASKDIRLYIDNTDTALLGTLSGGNNVSVNNTTLNIDFNQGQRIRLRAVDGTAGNIQDTVIKLIVKWRSV